MIVKYLLMETNQQHIQMETVEFEYTLYLKNNKLLDQNNIYSIVDKFFQDAIVDVGVIKDDNFKFSKRTIFNEPVINKGIKKRFVKVIIRELDDGQINLF